MQNPNSEYDSKFLQVSIKFAQLNRSVGRKRTLILADISYYKYERAMLPHEGTGSTGVISRPHRKPTYNKSCIMSTATYKFNPRPMDVSVLRTDYKCLEYDTEARVRTTEINSINQHTDKHYNNKQQKT
ncbi:hypothetical protein SFRURICE_012025 [Spodoptera frugiperda]|nr:hypothetical protein SFRURICE_012025 [Spodoptera frugiperda]